MLYERRWLGNSSYWIGEEKFDTKGEALASLNIRLKGHSLRTPWFVVHLPDLKIQSINKGIGELKELFRTDHTIKSKSIWAPRAVHTDGESYFIDHTGRFNSLEELADHVGLSLCGVYLSSGSCVLKLPRLDVATFTEGWFQLSEMEEIPTLKDQYRQGLTRR